jgi:CMP/dCMP kinase
MLNKIPVFTVDGPSGSGKGTVSRLIARAFEWHFLDSGALYRVLALAAMKHGIALDNEEGLEILAGHLDVVFTQEEPFAIMLEEEDVTYDIRTETCGSAASLVAALPRVRGALLERQRAFLEVPGLVADGRDMGTVVFPQADLKLFLDASVEVRAKRRQIQLKEQHIDVSLDSLLTDITARDVRDRQRVIAPLVAAKDAVILDTSALSITAVFEKVLEAARAKGFVPKEK